MNEGIIEYEVSYPNIEEGSMVKTFLPSTMLFTFKEDIFCSELNTSMGQFKVAFIADSKHKKLQQIFRLTPKKMYADIPVNTVDSMNLADYGQVKVEFLSDTMSMLGLPCKKALVSCDKQGEITQYQVVYTEAIRFEDPNWSLPFKEIKGIPLEYQVTRMGITMHFKAHKIQSQKIELSYFTNMIKGLKKTHYLTIDRELQSLAEDLSGLL